MGKHLCLLVTLEAFFCIAGSPHDAVAERLEHRWFYLPTNLLVDKNVEDAVVLLDRAAKAGYNGVVLSDSKFMRWDVVLRAVLPERPAGSAGMS